MMRACDDVGDVRNDNGICVECGDDNRDGHDN